MPPSEGDAKRAILARRARFIATALASVGVTALEMAACKENKEGAYPVDAEMRPASTETTAAASSPQNEAGPQPCLSESTAPAPAPCLSIAPPADAGPAPRPCLRKMRAPDDDAGF